MFAWVLCGVFLWGCIQVKNNKETVTWGSRYQTWACYPAWMEMEGSWKFAEWAYPVLWMWYSCRPWAQRYWLLSPGFVLSWAAFFTLQLTCKYTDTLQKCIFFMICRDFHRNTTTAAVSLGTKIFSGVLCEPRTFSLCSIMCSLAVDLSLQETGPIVAWNNRAPIFLQGAVCLGVCFNCGWESCWKKGACFQEVCGATSHSYSFDLPPRINPQTWEEQKGHSLCVVSLQR